MNEELSLTKANAGLQSKSRTVGSSMQYHILYCLSAWWPSEARSRQECTQKSLRLKMIRQTDVRWRELRFSCHPARDTDSLRMAVINTHGAEDRKNFTYLVFRFWCTHGKDFIYIKLLRVKSLWKTETLWYCYQALRSSLGISWLSRSLHRDDHMVEYSASTTENPYSFGDEICHHRWSSSGHLHAGYLILCVGYMFFWSRPNDTTKHYQPER